MAYGPMLTKTNKKKKKKKKKKKGGGKSPKFQISQFFEELW